MLPVYPRLARMILLQASHRLETFGATRKLRERLLKAENTTNLGLFLMNYSGTSLELFINLEQDGSVSFSKESTDNSVIQVIDVSNARGEYLSTTFSLQKMRGDLLQA